MHDNIWFGCASYVLECTNKTVMGPMTTRAASWGICWDTVAAGSVVASQRWLLSAMQKHGPILVTMLWRILGNEQDVCDAYQDTFLKLAQHQDGQRPNNVKSFVFRAASNVAISMLRRRKLRIKAHQAIAERIQQKQSNDCAADLDARQLQETLRTSIARLPDRLETVVVLKDLADLSYAQMAKIMNISVATARVYRCRAIKLLTTWMIQREEN